MCRYADVQIKSLVKTPPPAVYYYSLITPLLYTLLRANSASTYKLTWSYPTLLRAFPMNY